MSLSAKKSKKSFSEKKGQYKIRDLSLSDFGKKEIELAYTEMPGLMALREEYGADKPFKGVRISGSLSMTVQTAVLIETLYLLGADIRWCSCNIISSQDHAAAAMVDKGCAKVFAWMGETIEEFWWCMEQSLIWPDGTGPDLIIDDGGDATLLVHEGLKAEKAFDEKKVLPVIRATDEPDAKELKKLLIESVVKHPRRWQKVADRCVGVSEETTTGITRLEQMEKKNELLFPAINVNNSVTKTKFDNNYGCKHSLTDGIKRATDVLISGKTVVICGFGDVGKGCAAAMKGEGAKVIVTEIDPICALQACMEGYYVQRLEDVAEKADIVVTTTGNRDIVGMPVFKKLKNNAIVCNIGHFDNEIDVAALESDKSLRRVEIKPQVDRYVFPDGHGILVLAKGRVVNLGCATGHPSLVMSNSFTNQVLGVIELWKNKDTKKYEKKVYVLPRYLDEKVARLHLKSFDADLTTLTSKQADYIGVHVDGPFKSEAYRY